MRRVIITVAVFIIVIGAVFGRDEHVTSNPPNRHFINNVPFTRQLPNFCGPASLSSLLAYMGISAGQKCIASQSLSDGKTGTNGADMLLYCRNIGLSAYSFNGKIGSLKKLVAEDIPVIVLQDSSRENKEGHFRLVVGYNDVEGIIALRDSRKPDLVVMPYSEFDYLWGRRGRWALLVIKPENDRYSDRMGKNNPVLYMDLAQAYLHRGNTKQAEAEILKALQLQPNNAYAKDILSKIKLVTDVAHTRVD